MPLRDFTDEDMRKIQNLLDQESRRVNPLGNYLIGVDNSSSPSAYIAKVPIAGIPARTSTTLGNTLCEIYHPVAPSFGSNDRNLEAVLDPDGYPFELRVNNLSESDIVTADNEYVHIERDRFGNWIVDQQRCCLTGCLIASVDFSSLSGWSVKSGTWNAVSGVARTSSTSAIMLRSSAHPDGVTSHVVTVSMRGADGDKARVIIASDSTASSYLYAEITFGDPCGSLSINGGAAIPIDGALPDTWITLTVCYSEEVYSVYGSWNELLASVPSSFTTDGASGGSIEVEQVGTYVGLGTGATASQVDFDNFTWSKGPAAVDCPGCELCNGGLLLTWSGSGTTLDETCIADVTGTKVSGSLECPASVTPNIEFSARELELGVSVRLAYSVRPASVTLGPCRFDYNSGTNLVTLFVDGSSVGTLNGNGGIYQVSFINGDLCASVLNVAITSNRSITVSYPTPPTTIAMSTADTGNLLSYHATCWPDCESNFTCGGCVVPPSYYKVVIAGFVDADCATCDLVNGTHILADLTAGSGGTANSCFWSKTISGSSPCTLQFSLRIGWGFGTGFVSLDIITRYQEIGNTIHNYYIQKGSQYNCLTISDLELVYTASQSVLNQTPKSCDGAFATAFLTAL